MVTKLFTATTIGLDTQLVEVEVDLTPALPTMVVVGLPDKAVQESRERVKSAVKQTGFEFPLGKITVNLAPADIIKTGSGFDVPIAVGLLSLQGSITSPLPKEALFIGELALDGALRPVNSILTMCIWAKKNGYKYIFLPYSNRSEAALISGITCYGVQNLSELINHLNGISPIEPIKPVDINSIASTTTPVGLNTNTDLYPNDMAYIKGQLVAKRALEIAASGGHNIMLIGAPGSGKTLLARSYMTILPRLSASEILEVTQIYSAAGLLKSGHVIAQRPFRAPHHSASHVSIVGGGTRIKPGEVTLAHRGVLFLDEFPEFSRESIEALRQPLEDGHVTITRAVGSITYPSRFYLIAAANPTPNGFDHGDPAALHVPQNQSHLRRYRAKFSGPIMDRIDIHVHVDRPTTQELRTEELEEKSIEIARRVQNARNAQTLRFANEQILSNSEITPQLIRKFCVLDQESQKLLDNAVEKFHLSARAYTKIIKVARTIADLEDSEHILTDHIAEALQYRPSIHNN